MARIHCPFHPHSPACHSSSVLASSGTPSKASRSSLPQCPLPQTRYLLLPSLPSVFCNNTASNMSESQAPAQSQSQPQPQAPAQAQSSNTKSQSAGNRASARMSTYSAAPTLAPSLAPSHLSDASSMSGDPKAQDIKSWNAGFERLEDKRLVQQRYMLTNEKTDDMSKLALGAKLDRALSRRMSGQDAVFRPKVLSEKNIET
ncbi:hypothetical protein NX059_005215 [Plenodomus lindquistii]|nr:hypothetical protein NX059_005215 [Plenodomus lindquistii]